MLRPQKAIQIALLSLPLEGGPLLSGRTFLQLQASGLAALLLATCRN